MQFTEPITEIITRRVSYRTYKKDAVEPEKLDRLKKYMSEQTKGVFGNTVRFELLEQNDRSDMKLGTYGIIHGAGLYLTGAVAKGEKDNEDFGYLFEKLLLLATSLRLGSCWMAGTFQRSDFATRIGLKENETLPAISPIGYPTENRRLLDASMRFLVGSKTRKPFEKLFFEGDFSHPINELKAGDFQAPLEMVRRGPSASNKQPWRALKESGKPVFHFFIEYTPGYFNEYQHLDLGIAMAHFEMTASELYLHGEWKQMEEGKQYETASLKYGATWTME